MRKQLFMSTTNEPTDLGTPNNLVNILFPADYGGLSDCPDVSNTTIAFIAITQPFPDFW